MMKLTGASRYFDRTDGLDVATGDVLFKCQVDVYDDSKRDAVAAYRRIMSVAPGTVMPASGTVSIFGRVWLIGSSEPDGLEDMHREKYVIQAATTSLKISRLSGFLSGSVSSTVFASPNWVKDAKQLEVSSEAPQIFDITMPKVADARVNDVVWSADTAYLVLSPRPLSSGLQMVNCLKLDQITPVAASVSARTYNPTAGTFGAPSTSSVNALKVRWQSLYKYGSQASERYQEGDAAIVLPFGTVLTTSHQITLAGVTYQVLAVLDLAGAVVAHVRVV